jgi:hypothetical protein
MGDTIEKIINSDASLQKMFGNTEVLNANIDKVQAYLIKAKGCDPVEVQQYIEKYTGTDQASNVEEVSEVHDTNSNVVQANTEVQTTTDDVREHDDVSANSNANVETKVNNVEENDGEVIDLDQGNSNVVESTPQETIDHINNQNTISQIPDMNQQFASQPIDIGQQVVQPTNTQQTGNEQIGVQQVVTMQTGIEQTGVNQVGVGQTGVGQMGIQQSGNVQANVAQNVVPQADIQQIVTFQQVEPEIEEVDNYYQVDNQQGAIQQAGTQQTPNQQFINNNQPMINNQMQGMNIEQPVNNVAQPMNNQVNGWGAQNQQFQNPVAPMQQSVMNQDFYQAQGAQTFAPNANIQPQVNTNAIDGSQPSVQNTNQGSDQLVLVENNKESIIKKILNKITNIFKKKNV